MVKDFVFKINDIPNVDAGKKNALFILDKSEKLPNIEQTLFKMAEAVKINPETELEIIWTEEAKSGNFGPILTNYLNIIVFGLKEESIGLQTQALQPYRIYHFEGFQIQFSASVTELNKDKSKKLQLWNSIQKQFLSGK